MSSMTRMRTIDGAWAEIISADPDTALTKTALRRLIVSGQVKTCRVGTKYLINMDVLWAYLNGQERVSAFMPMQGIITE